MTRSGLIARILIVAAVSALVLAGPVLATVDDYPRLLPHGTTVGDLAHRGDLRAFPGDLYDVTGGLIMPRVGGAPVVEVDGSRASTDTAIAFGAVVTSDRGSDSVEPTEAITVGVPPAGSTSATVAAAQGTELGLTPDSERLIRGAVSKIVVERTLLVGDVPVTLRPAPPNPEGPVVALTFDDGPWPGQTAQFVAALTEAGAKGTFFMVGRYVDRYPDIARGVAAAGMEIGAHSQSHKLLAHASHKVVRSQIGKGITTIERVTGTRPAFYRPAGGSQSGYVRTTAARMNVRLVMWTIDPKDWKKPKATTIARRILKRIKPGSIVLMHDGGGDRSRSLAALRIVLAELTARGYRTVTLSELYAQ